MEEDLEDAWLAWHSEVGHELGAEIEKNFRSTFHLFDLLDGTHAKWIQSRSDDEDDYFGILLVFSEEELAELMTAWLEAQEGNMRAGASVANWLSTFFQFIDGACEEDFS
mgnify:FL=1